EKFCVVTVNFQDMPQIGPIRRRTVEVLRSAPQLQVFPPRPSAVLEYFIEHRGKTILIQRNRLAVIRKRNGNPSFAGKKAVHFHYRDYDGGRFILSFGACEVEGPV